MSHQKMAATTKAMLVVCTFGLSSFIAVAVAPPALDKSYANQDSVVQQAKWRNAGYFDDENGIELSINQEDLDDNVSYMASKQCKSAKHANDFLADTRQSINNQSNNR